MTLMVPDPLGMHETHSDESGNHHTRRSAMERFMESLHRHIRIAMPAFAILGATTLAWTFASAGNALAADSGSASRSVYVAHLHPMNNKVTGLQTTGEARFSIVGDQLTISLKARGLPPNIIHWQHFHGFADNRAASCPGAAADVNGDGIIDLIETGPAAGTTMVPFTDNPVAMDIAHGTYPQASANGTYTYRQTVSLKDLTAAFSKTFNDPALDLDRRVIFIHGVVNTSQLPATVASLGPIPASVTLPIACGRIERVNR